MKRILSFTTVLSMALFFVACDGKSSEENARALEEDTITTDTTGDYHQLTVDIDESTESLERKIDEIEAELDSL